MKTTFILAFLFFILGKNTFAQGTADTMFFSPDHYALFDGTERDMFRMLSANAEKLGMFKKEIEPQWIKIYVATDTAGNVIKVYNGGCKMDPDIENWMQKAFMQLPPFIPAVANGQNVIGARLFEFNLENHIDLQAQFSVKVSLAEKTKLESKDFTLFIKQFTPEIKQHAFYPKNYKPEKLDGLVQVEFNFNKNGRPTNFKIIKEDKQEFNENSLITLFSTVPISKDYVAMIGPDHTFVATFDYIAYADLYGFFPSNH